MKYAIVLLSAAFITFASPVTITGKCDAVTEMGSEIVFDGTLQDYLDLGSAGCIGGGTFADVGRLSNFYFETSNPLLIASEINIHSLATTGGTTHFTNYFDGFYLNVRPSLETAPGIVVFGFDVHTERFFNFIPGSNVVVEFCIGGYGGASECPVPATPPSFNTEKGIPGPVGLRYQIQISSLPNELFGVYHSIKPIPEPSSIGLAALGLAALLYRRCTQ